MSSQQRNKQKAGSSPPQTSGMRNGRRNTVTSPRWRPRGQNRRNFNPGRRTTRPNNNAQLDTGWFHCGSGEIGTATAAVVLQQTVLHPTNFQGTPYFDMTNNYCTRVEEMISFQLRCTTATTTGARLGVILINDPSWNNQTMTRELALSMIANGKGSEVTVTNTTTQTRNFKPGSKRLSNSSPPEGANFYGYASGLLVVVLLDPPVAIGGSGVLKWDMMMRLHLSVAEPVAGFGSFASGTGTDVEPTEVSFSIHLQAAALDTTPAAGTWRNDHTGTTWLAGGWYMRFPSSRPKVLIGDQGQTDGITVTGTPLTFAVYELATTAGEWENNDGERHVPYYFVTWHEPGSGVVQVVGFRKEHKNYAIDQAKGSTGAIPHGAELCFRYTTQHMEEAHWKNLFNFSLNMAVSFQIGNLEDSKDTLYTLNFKLVTKTNSSKPVWSDNRTTILQNPEVGVGDNGTTMPTALFEDEDDDDQVDLGFQEAASCASSRNSDGNRQRSFMDTSNSGLITSLLILNGSIQRLSQLMLNLNLDQLEIGSNLSAAFEQTQATSNINSIASQSPMPQTLEELWMHAPPSSPDWTHSTQF